MHYYNFIVFFFISGAARKTGLYGGGAIFEGFPLCSGAVGAARRSAEVGGSSGISGNTRGLSGVRGAHHPVTVFFGCLHNSVIRYYIIL
jgi:hypothetical protein